MEKKVCPLSPNKARTDLCLCLGNQCAWWNDLSEQCAVITIAQGLLFTACESEVNDNDGNVDNTDRASTDNQS